MTTRLNESSGERPLENLGIGELEERIYRWLLEHPAASASEAARGLMLTPGKAQRLLEAIGSKGLTTHTPERPRRYIPSSPDVAIEALIQQRQKGLQDARLIARELQEKAASGYRDSHKQIVELITSRTAGAQILEQMTRSARQEIVNLVRPPLWISRLDLPPEQDRPFQRDAQARGVSYRTVIDEDFLDLTGAIQGVRADMKAGEKVRIAPFLPLKAIMVDRRIALIPLDLQKANGPSLLVRSSALLDSFYALFEFLWNSAVPLYFTDDKPQLDANRPQLSNELKELVSLMAAGLNDKTISYDLNIPKRSFTRRISRLMGALNARTRFQAGWLAASLDLGEEPETARKSNGKHTRKRR